MNKALIFIPDISGFTRFVNATPIEHSRHIISELLQLVIDADQLGMTVSEVEGDAVLFYREGPPPTMDEVLEQARKMFLAFHAHLKRYESLRICHCDACSSARGLSLKFVVHYGEVGFIRVMNSSKPHGKALIVAHRLLKNSIEKHEYLLVTKEFRQQTAALSTQPGWAEEVNDQSEKFDGGETFYDYFKLSELLKEVPPAPLPPLPEKSKSPISVEGKVKGSLDDVFEMVSNLSMRSEWNPNVKILGYNEDEINRAGSSHLCVVGNSEVHISTVHAGGDADTRTFGERVDKVPVIGKVSVYYIMKAVKGGTSVRMEAHFPKLPIHKRLIAALFKRRLKSNLIEALGRLNGIFVG